MADNDNDGTELDEGLKQLQVGGEPPLQNGGDGDDDEEEAGESPHMETDLESGPLNLTVISNDGDKSDSGEDDEDEDDEDEEGNTKKKQKKKKKKKKKKLLGLWRHLQKGDYTIVLKHYLWKKLIWPNFFILCLLTACFFVFLFCGIFVWDHFTWEAWYALSVTVATFCMLIKNLYDPSVTMILSTTLLVAAQIVTPKDAISGTPIPLSLFTNSPLLSYVANSLYGGLL